MRKRSTLLLLLLAGFLSHSYAQQDTTATKKKRPRENGRELVKGTWAVGATLSLKSNDMSNTDYVLVNLINFKQNAFVIRAEGGYFFRDNLSAGLGVEYGQNLFDVKGNIYNNDDVKGYRSFNRSIAFTPYIKNFIPMSKNNTFYVTNQTELRFLYKQGTSENFQNGELNRSHLNRYEYGIGIRPGIMVFFTKNLAFETNIGVLGLTHYEEKSTHTNKEDSKRNSTNIDLKFDILKLGFGFSYYFNKK